MNTCKKGSTTVRCLIMSHFKKKCNNPFKQIKFEIKLAGTVVGSNPNNVGSW